MPSSSSARRRTATPSRVLAAACSKQPEVVEGGGALQGGAVGRSSPPPAGVSGARATVRCQGAVRGSSALRRGMLLASAFGSWRWICARLRVAVNRGQLGTIGGGSGRRTDLLFTEPPRPPGRIVVLRGCGAVC